MKKCKRRSRYARAVALSKLTLKKLRTAKDPEKRQKLEKRFSILNGFAWNEANAAMPELERSVKDGKKSSRQLEKIFRDFDIKRGFK
jgi:hypothetical protein